MRKYLILLAAAASITVCAPAMAGFTATTGLDFVNTPDANNNLMADVGEQLTMMGVAGGSPATPAGTFSTYVPDTPQDPQITAGDLNRYRYVLDGAASAVSGAMATYTGNYTIFYDQNLDGMDNDGLLVSAGNFSIDANFTLVGTATLNGFLNQTTGPNNASFADLGMYGPVSYTGTYTPIVAGAGLNNYGSITGVLRSNTAAVIPEPGTFALLGTGLLPLLGLRRRNRK